MDLNSSKRLSTSCPTSRDSRSDGGAEIRVMSDEWIVARGEVLEETQDNDLKPTSYKDLLVWQKGC